MATRQEKQAQLTNTHSSAPQSVIPKIPTVPLPAKVVSAFPDMKNWQKQTEESNEEWRKKTSIAVLGSIPTPS